MSVLKIIHMENDHKMDEETRFELAQRLWAAQQRTQQAFEKADDNRDVHPGTAIAQAWPFITAGYSGIEQTFKFLIATERGWTIDELLAYKKDPESRSRPDYLTHDLHYLYEDLDEATKQQLDDYWTIFRSLHDYVDVESLKHFLSIVSDHPAPQSDTGKNSKGRGYERWRYSLIQSDSPLPKNSPLCLIAIWNACAQIADGRSSTGSVLKTPGEEIAEWCAVRLEDIMTMVSINRQGRGIEFENYQQEYAIWVKGHGHPLNAFSQVLHDWHRGIGPAAGGASGLMQESLMQWLETIERDLAEASTDVRRFVAKALGRRGPAAGIRWNGGERHFEAIPWSLKPTVLDEPPAGSFEIQGGHNRSRLNSVVARIRRQEFEVMENLQLEGDMPAGRWLCTVYAEKSLADGNTLTLRIWEFSKRGSSFFVEASSEINSDDAQRIRNLVEAWSQMGKSSGVRVKAGPEEGGNADPG